MTMIERGYLRIGQRLVHYRRKGSGPVIVLLHASPVSSVVFLDQIEVFGESFTAIAIDTPGYGLSDPLGIDTPGIADFADALIPALDALGVEKAHLYGRHTGASIAVETARRHPTRVAGVLCDGYPVFPPAVRDRYLADYLVPVAPRWDGGHLGFWWQRFRDQHVFWPWDLQDSAHRADTDVPSLDFLNRGFTSIMEAGDGYVAAYAAAFRHDAIEALAETTIPCWLTVRPGDSLYAARGDVPDGHPKSELPRETIDAAHAEVAVFQTVRDAAGTPLPASVPQWPLAAGRWLLPVAGGALHVSVLGETDRAPIVVIAPQPGGLASLETLLPLIGASWPVIGVEAPGQADSETALPQSIEESARIVAAAFAALGCKPALVVGVQGSSGIAVEWARAEGLAVALLDPPLVDEATRARYRDSYPIDATPRQDGGHVPAVWTLLRDERLWAPWFDRRRATALAPVMGIEADQLHRRAVDLLKQASNIGALMRQVWEHPLAERLPETCPILRGDTAIFGPGELSAPDLAAALIALVPR